MAILNNTVKILQIVIGITNEPNIGFSVSVGICCI